MRVTPRRYLSALEKMPAPAALVAVGFILCFSSCDHAGGRAAARDGFAELYAESMMLGKLYSDDSASLKRVLDSLYASRGTDAAGMKTTMQWYAERPEENAAMLKDAAMLLERLSNPDSAASPAR